MIYLFGKPKSVIVYKIDQHKLKSDVELNIKAIFKYHNNLNINFCANMLSNENERKCIISTKNENIIINHLANQIKISGKKSIIRFKDSVNDSYMKEVKYIFKCISKNVKSIFSIQSFDINTICVECNAFIFKSTEKNISKMNNIAFIFARGDPKESKTRI